MSNKLVGRTIKKARPMTAKELSDEDWSVSCAEESPLCLVLDDGTKLYPSMDAEGNGPGEIFGVDPDGKSVRFAVTG